MNLNNKCQYKLLLGKQKSIFILIITLLFIVFGGCNKNEHKLDLTKSSHPKVYPKAIGGETRATLAPETFSDKSRYGNAEFAYKIAKEIPHILDKIFCYCYCQDNPSFKHKSLLTCYVDDHAAQCGDCLSQAIVAYELYKSGNTPEQIVELENKQFYRSQHSH
ncbi:MAG: PCYCGC domain-containing protein [Spirochaetota bacterium]|nr:PCYCGC domain-containing protein [Spirochaetota bacterium]